MRIPLTILLFTSMLTVQGQSALDLGSQARLRSLRLDARQSSDAGYARTAHALRRSPAQAGASSVAAMIRLAPGTTAEHLQQAGGSILFQRGDIVGLLLPLDAVELMAALPCVEKMQLASDVHAQMAWAREAAGAESIRQGIGLERPYTGKGIVCGVVDTGMDPNHVNFREADGSSRIGMLAHLKYNAAAASAADVVKTKFYDAQTIADFTTDAPTAFHGTHTMGIMAGGYDGQARVARRLPDGSVSVEEQAHCPFYGVAPEADIAAAALENLDDIFIAYGTDFISQYAEQLRRPYVVNISLGSNTGPHDGSSLIGQFFDRCAADGAIICVASGNSGDTKVAATKTLTADDPELKTFIGGYDADLGSRTAYARQGNITIYSHDETPFEIQAVIFNKKRGTISKRYALNIDASTCGTGKYWVSAAEYMSADTDILDTTFGKYFEGYVGMGWNYDSDNGRFYAIIDYTAIDDATQNADGNYALGFIVAGSEGQLLNAYCDGNFSFMTQDGVEGWDDGSTNGSINDLACSPSVIAVGAYNTASQWAALDGSAYFPQWEAPEGGITAFSGYGTLNDGRELPLVCAPGAVIMSSVSRYYAASDEADPTMLGAVAEAADGTKHYWGASSGTSMASPFLAGTIALWLEADPTLTLADVRDIIATTAVRDEAVAAAEPVRAGAGKLDAYAGLKEVVRRKAAAGLAPTLAAGAGRMLVDVSSRGELNVCVPGAESMEVCLTDMAGKVIVRTAAAGTDEVCLPIASLLPGTYIIAANGQQSKCLIP